MPRILAVVEKRDGGLELVNIGRPAALVAFAEKFGKMAPEDYPEVAWLAHRALDVDVELEEWLETLEDLDAGDRVAEVELQLRGRLEPPELLEALSAAEVVELGDTPSEHEPGRSKLDELLDSVARTLQRRADEAERDAAAAMHNAELDREKRTRAADRLGALTEAELEAMPADDLDRLKREAGVSVEVPTTPAPAPVGDGE